MPTLQTPSLKSGHRPQTWRLAERAPRLPRFVRLGLIVAFTASLVALAIPAGAAQSDRAQPMVLEADRSGSMDLQRQVFVYEGNAVITQGTMVMRADRIEVRQTADGFFVGQAIGSASKPASWRQSRDGVNEIVEGSAGRIEFDGRADTLRFVGNSAVRRLRNGVVADEITGGTIVWNNLTEVFRVDGGASTVTNPSGRVRAVLAPRVDASGSDPNSSGAAAPGAAPAPAPAPTPAPTPAQAPAGLTPSRGLGPAPSAAPNPAPASGSQPAPR